MKSTNNQSIAEIAAVNALQEVSMEELDQIIGAGNGVVLTLTHECNLATWTTRNLFVIKVSSTLVLALTKI